MELALEQKKKTTLDCLLRLWTNSRINYCIKKEHWAAA